MSTSPLVDERINILRHLKHRRIALQVLANCHAYLYSRYWYISWTLTFLLYSVQIVALGYVVWKGGSCAAGNTTPALTMQGFVFLFGGIIKHFNYEQIYDRHRRDEEGAREICNDMEQLETMNQGSKESLQKIFDEYTAKIATQRSKSEPIPVWVKTKIQRGGRC